jgi:hypothetical protein
MSDIDPEKLERALNSIEELSAGFLSFGQELIVKAARAHLATLPRFKEVEVVQWATFDGRDVYRVFDHEEAAQKYASDCNSGLVVVRLTGTAKIKVAP